MEVGWPEDYAAIVSMGERMVSKGNPSVSLVRRETRDETGMPLTAVVMEGGESGAMSLAWDRSDLGHIYEEVEKTGKKQSEETALENDSFVM